MLRFYNKDAHFNGYRRFDVNALAIAGLISFCNIQGDIFLQSNRNRTTTFHDVSEDSTTCSHNCYPMTTICIEQKSIKLTKTTVQTTT